MSKSIVAFAVFSFLLAVSAFAQARPTLAVLELRVKDMDRESMLLYVDSLSGALFRSGRVDVVDRSRREAAIEEIEFSASAAADAKAQIDVGRQLAASHIVSGSLGRYGGDFVASLKLVETATAKVAGSAEEVYPSFDKLLANADEMARSLLRSTPSPSATKRVPPALAPTPAPSGVDPVDSILANSVAPTWTPFQLSIWSPLQLFPASADVYGIRIALPYSRNASLIGIDVGLVNILSGGMSGIQCGILSKTITVLGIQTGVVGIAERVVLQANAVYNQTEVLVGAQVGVVNVGNRCVGLQIGVVNVAGLLKGVQIGIVNIVRYGDRAGFMPVVNVRL